MLKEERLAQIILITGMVIASVAAIIWAMQPIEKIVTNIPDDSFFYFQTASNIAKGYIPSIDGSHIGNGFHPLWMYVLVPIFALKSIDLALPVHLTLLLCGFFFVFSSFNIYRIFRILTDSPLLSACASVTFLFFTQGFVRILDGEVTALNIFILSFLLIVYLKSSRNNHTHRGSFILLGILSGLLFLQRHDNIIFLALLILHYIFSAKDTKNKLSNLLIASGFAFLVVLPWLVYSYIQFGTIAPTSSWAVPAVNHARWEDQYPGFWGSLHKSMDLIGIEFSYFITFSFVYYFIIISCLVLIFYYFKSGNKDRNNISLILTLGLFFWTLI